MKRFAANAIAVDEMPENESFVIVLAESAESQANHLVLSASLSPEAGEDSYCLTDEFQRTWYGGIRECRLTPDCLILLLEGEAAQHMGVTDGYTIEIPTTPANLEAGLRRILAASPTPVPFSVSPGI